MFVNKAHGKEPAEGWPWWERMFRKGVRLSWRGRRGGGRIPVTMVCWERRALRRKVVAGRLLWTETGTCRGMVSSAQTLGLHTTDLG